MFTFYALIFFLSVFLLLAGLIRPKIFERVIKKIPRRSRVALFFSGLIFLSFAGMIFFVPAETKKEVRGVYLEQPEEDGENSWEEEGDSSALNLEKNIKVEDLDADTAEEIFSELASEENLEAEAENLIATDDNLISDSLVLDEDLEDAEEEEKTDFVPAPIADVWAKVISVVDGDTLKVSLNGKTETLRLIGINTPETVDPRRSVECFGREASNRAKALLGGQTVRLSGDPTQDERDKYGRLLRYLWLSDGTFFNLKMISDGYAYEYTYKTAYQYQTEFKKAQATAKAQGRGLWADDACLKSSSAPSPSSTSATSSAHVFYVSSSTNVKYYYCDTDEAWKNLSPKYLKSFSNVADLLSAFPGVVLHEACK